VFAAPVPDETPAKPEEWGFRPADGSIPSRNPPAFVWRPQRNAIAYELHLQPTAHGEGRALTYPALRFNAFCPPRTLEPGDWQWKFRFVTAKGETSAWSSSRSFRVHPNAVLFPMPALDQLLARIPAQHPRLFIRPEHLSTLRSAALGPSSVHFAALTQRCERLLSHPPSSDEPPKYPADMPRESDEWMRIWWGNRERTIALLDGAATLGFVWRLGGPDRYADTARNWLLAAARWDPRGSTGFRYNDEAGMPFVCYFARAYTFLHSRLSEADRQACRAVIRQRGDDMYRHLCPSQLWTPYESHANRAWHKLGEAAIAFSGEFPETRDWMEFVLLKQFCTYPVWNGEDGGWHEGPFYWLTYSQRFTWWAIAFHVACGVDVFRLPFFARAGWYPIYLAPPGAPRMGIGDLSDRQPPPELGDVVGTLATLVRNRHWQWYAEQMSNTRRDVAARLASGPCPYITYLQNHRTPLSPLPPTNLPSSAVFRGVGQAALNTCLLHSSNNVSVIFKSSPMGSISHGYDAQNSFVLSAFGVALLIPTGQRDQYGSAHHRKWMWETKSVNSVTLNGGAGQIPHSPRARGRILGFHTSPGLHYVAGEAAEAYDGRLRQFTRHILLLEPGLVVVHDQIEATAPSTFDWWFHTPVPLRLEQGRPTPFTNGPAVARLTFIEPHSLRVTVTDRFDVPPRPKIRLTQWHLTASTEAPAHRTRGTAAVQVWRVGDAAPPPLDHRQVDGLCELRVPNPRAPVLVRLGGTPDAVDVVELAASGPRTLFRSSSATISDAGAR